MFLSNESRVEVADSIKMKGNLILSLDNWEDWEDFPNQSNASVISLTDVGYQEQMKDYRKPRHINDVDILDVFPIMTLLKFYHQPWAFQASERRHQSD